MMFYVHTDRKHSFWEFRYKNFKIKSELFSARYEAIENLEKTILYTEQASLFKEDEKSLVFFKTKQTTESWSWIACSTFNNIKCISFEEDFRCSSLQNATDRANQFKVEVITSPIVDTAKVLIPSMHFSKSFADRFDINDIHKSCENKKLSKNEWL